MYKKQITLILIFIALICIYFQTISASGSQKQMNVTVVSDLNQTVGKDIISLVDTNRLDISNNPVFNVLWSPDGSHILIDVFVSAYPKGKPQFGGVYALYAANADGNANGAAYPYPNSRYGWAQMVRDWYAGGWTYDGSDHGRRVVTIHEIGHMFDAGHDNSGGFNQAYDWWSGLTHYYTVMWSTYEGNNGLYEFSSLGYNDDGTHNNARSIREAKDTVSNYV